MNKTLTISLICILICALSAFGIYKYVQNNKVIDNKNICQDDIMVNKLIDNNANPFTKFKFIKKRNNDCKVLLFTNREDALKTHKQDYCSFLDSSTNSLTVLINAYVHEMYDRESASKEFGLMTPLMTPYDYCPQYLNNMVTLITIKKRLGL